jgi:hypothetical protein
VDNWKRKDNNDGDINLLDTEWCERCQLG